MKRKQNSGTKISRVDKTSLITYVTQKKLSNLVKKKSAFAMWCEREELRLSNRPETQNFDKAYQQFQEERDRRRSELWDLEKQALDEKKRKERPPWPDFPPTTGAFNIKKQLTPLRSTFFEETEVAPTKTLIYHDAPACASNQIYPCPDLRRWSAWFENKEVTLNQGYRHWFPSSIQHPMLKKYYLTGEFIVNTEFILQGVVDIGPYGSVTVDVATYLTVVQCDAPDKNHDNGWHYDPNYDTNLSTWRSYCDGDQQRIFSDSQRGLHTFAHYIDLPVTASCSCGAPNRFVEVTHILTITAVNATCQFGPNGEDCATGSCYGWITTQWPKISVEYYGPWPWDRVFFPIG